MKQHSDRLCALVSLTVAFVGLVASSPLSAQQPKLRAILEGHKGYVESVVFSSDGKLLASGSADDTVKLWDVATGKEKTTLMTHSPLLSVAFGGDGKLLASASI